MSARADLALTPLRLFRRSASAGAIQRVLLLRLERIGDLLMVLDAIADARAAWPDAEIDLAVGSWNLPLARLIPGLRSRRRRRRAVAGARRRRATRGATLRGEGARLARARATTW